VTFFAQLLADDTARTALLAGIVVSALSGALGYFTVLRRLSFVGHAVTDFGLAGGAGAVLVGWNALWGFLAFSIAGALAVDRLARSERERDVTTGIVLSVALGLGALFLFFSTRFVSEPAALLFGSIFDLDPSLVGTMTLLAFACFATLAAMYRPLSFATISPDAARARGVPVTALGYAYMLLLAVGVAESSQVVGVLLSTALLIGPAAAAMYLVRRPLAAIGVAMLLGSLQTALGIALAYASYTWPPHRHGWPVSFFVTVLALAMYVAARLWNPAGRRPLPSAAR
jgi:zinc/manganese transport system permease protein